MADVLTFPSHTTFRDPAGSVELRPDGAYRSIYAPFDRQILEFLALPLASDLVAQGKLIASEVLPGRREANTPADNPAEALVLRHPRVSFQSYPWEWPPTLWLAAAELTLTLCRDLLDQGWLLKDATPLNILFRGAQPVFVDVLSIERADPHQPIWLAYAQFVRTFLLPMLAHQQLGWPLPSAMTRRDGVEPEEIYAALSWPQRLLQPALSAVTLPKLLAGNKKLTASKSVQTGTLTSRAVEDPELARHILMKTLRTLQSRMRAVTPRHHASTWSGYAETAAHYSEADHARKRAFVAEALASAKAHAEPSQLRVLDVGCNTGVYSRLAAGAGAEVVAIDTDLQAVDRLAASLKATGDNILPLCVDLAHPSPAIGWENRESAAFLTRCHGHFDAVMMLAVLHHLLLRNQIPLNRIAALCASLTTRHLILEWVPQADPKFQELLRGRGTLYAHLTETAFREAFAEQFTTLDETPLANGRLMLHLVKTGSRE